MTDHDQPSQRPEPRDARPDLVRVRGELDLDTGRAAELDAALRRAITDPDNPAEITVDVSELMFCDSTGLNILLHAQLAALSHGRTLRLRAPNPQLVRLLHRAGALTLFTLDPPPAA
ncbi:STAS domain-containing protein [Streptomyces sp. NBC_00513]|uniref:STAS domain-containing protein n=1 Tax=unclassified Streptomyces TaxID=2593676 RepID=UPI00224F6883|nr:STAS domain-containing protein [Streptomyces sp. NBC_00424]MCX5078628.1 STAS domain-containing protein [Streptomyces sp. NBC_00424]WUD39073.1 STAS domain-containing protein [Streptomyces sp. NBC_00513]WUD45656.1 STAS domain-containing protein [Streptomyces sp. NBC_00513]